MNLLKEEKPIDALEECIYLAISAVSDELLRVLRHLRVEVVHHHEHHGGAGPAAGRVLVDWVSSAKQTARRAVSCLYLYKKQKDRELTSSGEWGGICTCRCDRTA